MAFFEIRGGIPLRGSVTVSGAKNAALPIICASIMADEPCRIENLPDIEDVNRITEILSSMGAAITRPAPGVVVIDPRTIKISAATLAIGMALSGTAQNFAGGVMILLMKPYRVGDFISAQGQSGTVREIKLFSTVITTGDNQTIYIPNNSIATAIIDNYSTSETRRVDWTIGISYGDDVDAARRALLDLLAADSRVLTDPAPVVWVAALADSSVNLSVRAWVKNADYWDVFFENNEKTYKLLPLKGISFPFPQMDVHVKQN